MAYDPLIELFRRAIPPGTTPNPAQAELPLRGTAPMLRGTPGRMGPPPIQLDLPLGSPPPVPPPQPSSALVKVPQPMPEVSPFQRGPIYGGYDVPRLGYDRAFPPKTGANFAERVARPSPSASMPPSGNPFAERMARPAPPPASAMPTPPFTLGATARFLAGGAVPTLVGHLTNAVDQADNPAKYATDDQIRMAAEDNPTQAAATWGAERIKQAFSRPVEKTSNTSTVKYGQVANYSAATKPITFPRPAPTPLEAGPTTVTPMLTSLGNGYGVAGANTSGRAGYSNRTYYDPSGNIVASGLSSATGRGGFAGAATDAEADRNLKARFEQDDAARTMAASMNRGAEAMRELRAAQIADLDGYKPETPAAPGLDQLKFNYQQNIDANKFLLDKERFNYQQRLDKERLAIDKSEAEGKQSARQLERKKYMDESRKAFTSEFSFSDPKAPKDQIAGAVFDISQATGLPTDVVSQFYEQVVKDLKIDYSKGGPKDPMKLNELVAARITQAYQGQ